MTGFDPYLTWLGVPPTQRPPTLYQLLGVDPTITDPQVVKTLAIQRIAYVRNFQRGEQGELCARILEELSEAEATLSDPVKRADYDRRLTPPPVIATPATRPSSPEAPRQTSVVQAVPVRELEAGRPSPRSPRRKRRRRPDSHVALWVGGSAALLLGAFLAYSLIQALMTRSDVNQSTTHAQTIGSTLLPKGTSLQPTILVVIFERPWADAILKIDGVQREVSPSGCQLELLPGEHGVTVTRGAAGQYSTQVMLRAGELREFRIPAAAFRDGNPPAVAGTSPSGGAKGSSSGAIKTPPMQPASPPKMKESDELVSANYAVDPSNSTITVVKGSATVTKKGFGLFQIHARRTDFDDGVEFSLKSGYETNKMVRVDPRMVGQDLYSVVWLRHPTARWSDPPPVYGPRREVLAIVYVNPKGASAEVVSGDATVSDKGQGYRVLALPKAFEEGIEVLFTKPNYGSIRLRLDSDLVQRGRGQYFPVVTMPRDKGSAK